MKFMALPPPPRSFIGGAKYLKKKSFFSQMSSTSTHVGKNVDVHEARYQICKMCVPWIRDSDPRVKRKCPYSKKNDLNLINRPHYFNI